MILRPLAAPRTVIASYFYALRQLKDYAGGRLVKGVALYDGETGPSFGDEMYAIPIRLIWEGL